MIGNVDHFIGMIERIAPVRFAEAWDNVGLQIGSRSWPVKKIWTALDPLPEVVNRACENDVDLLVTHHPLFFKPIKRIDCEKPLGRLVQTAVSRRLAVYSAHTNLDSAVGGVNDVLAERIGMTDLRVLADDDIYTLEGVDRQVGLGRVGDLSASMSLAAFAEQIKMALNLDTLRVVGDLDTRVKTIAVCSGSGASLFAAALGSGAQVYVSGDLGYHTARDAQQAGIGLVDVGHFGSERLIADVLASSIRQASQVQGLDVVVEAATMETDPFQNL